MKALSSIPKHHAGLLAGAAVADADDSHQAPAPPWIVLQGRRHEPMERPERARELRAALSDLGLEAREARSYPERGLLAVHTVGSYRKIGGAVGALTLPTLVVQEGGYALRALRPTLAALLTGLGDEAG